MTIAAVTGGREYVPTARDPEQLRQWLMDHSVTVLRHGACRGVDQWAAGVASDAGITVEPWDAPWDLGPSAGPLRNRAMLRGDPTWNRPTSGPADCLAAFPGGRGTADCCRAATELKIDVTALGGRKEDEALPTVVNRHHYARFPSEGRYIGRGTPLGNPFTVQEHDDALERYKRWIWDKIQRQDASVLAEMKTITPQTLLVCSCKPRPCHGDVVVAAWSWMRDNGLL